MFAVTLGLASAVAWGLTDFIAGITSRRLAALWVTLGLEIVGLAIVLPFALITDPVIPPRSVVLLAIVAGVSGAVALSLFFHALSIGKMGVVAPLASVGVVIPVAAGVISGNAPGAVQFIGIGAALVGVMLAVRARDQNTEVSAANQRKSVIYALLSAIGFGFFFLFIDPISEHSIPWALVTTRVGGIPTIAILIFSFNRRYKLASPEAADLPVLLILGGLDLTANSLYALATTHGLVSVVAVLASLYPITTVVLARVVLKEQMMRLQLLGISCALGGAVLMAVG